MRRLIECTLCLSTSSRSLSPAARAVVSAGPGRAKRREKYIMRFPILAPLIRPLRRLYGLVFLHQRTTTTKQTTHKKKRAKVRATKTKGDTHLVSDAAVGAGQRSRCRQGRRRLHGRRRRRRLWMGRFLFFFLLPLDADDGQSRGCRWRHRHRGRMDVGTRGVSVVVADADRRRIRLATAIGARVRPESGADCETLLADLAPAAIGRLLPHSF